MSAQICPEPQSASTVHLKLVLSSSGDEQRRRLERNLHDGAQQRLVALAVQLRVLQKKIEDPELARQLLGAASDMATA